jgi:hypothetical protein
MACFFFSEGYSENLKKWIKGGLKVMQTSKNNDRERNPE